jgi:hypothetical protein
VGAGYRSILYVTAHAVLHTSDEILGVSNLDLAKRVIYLTGSGSVDEGGDSTENPEQSTSHHSDEFASPNTKQPQGFSEKEKVTDFGNMSQSSKFEQRMQLEDQQNEEEVTENKAVRQCAVLGKEVSQLRQQVAHMQTEHEEALRRAGSGKAELEALNSSLKNDMAKITTKVRSRDTHRFTVYLRGLVALSITFLIMLLLLFCVCWAGRPAARRTPTVKPTRRFSTCV